jgi:hypothetical protein
MTFDAKKASKKAETKLRLYEATPELLALFEDKSFAITEDDAFVPLIPRHMTSDNWRDLFWHQPTLVVVKGRQYPSLCSMCLYALKCVRKPASFECKATAKRLMLEEEPP